MRTFGKIAVAVAVLAYCAAVVAGKISQATKLSWVELALVCFVMLWLGGAFERIVELSVGDLHARFDRMESRQDTQESILAAIKIALTGVVTKYEYEHLVGLSRPEAYLCRYGHIFFGEIARLDSIGFIRPIQGQQRRGFNGVKEDHEANQETFDLKAYVELTDAGRAYLSARGSIGGPRALPKAAGLAA